MLLNKKKIYYSHFLMRNFFLNDKGFLLFYNKNNKIQQFFHSSILKIINFPIRFMNNNLYLYFFDNKDFVDMFDLINNFFLNKENYYLGIFFKKNFYSVDNFASFYRNLNYSTLYVYIYFINFMVNFMISLMNLFLKFIYLLKKRC